MAKPHIYVHMYCMKTVDASYQKMMMHEHTMLLILSQTKYVYV